MRPWSFRPLFPTFCLVHSELLSLACILWLSIALPCFCLFIIVHTYFLYAPIVLFGPDRYPWHLASSSHKAFQAFPVLDPPHEVVPPTQTHPTDAFNPGLVIRLQQVEPRQSAEYDERPTNGDMFVRVRIIASIAYCGLLWQAGSRTLHSLPQLVSTSATINAGQCDVEDNQVVCMYQNVRCFANQSHTLFALTCS